VRQQILQDLLAHDWLGCRRTRPAEPDRLRALLCSIGQNFRPGENRMVISAHGHTHVEAFPISIDFRAFSEQVGVSAGGGAREANQSQHHDIQITVGVDRLDYTKGIPERLKAFGYFFTQLPAIPRKVQLIQIVVPSREGIPRYDQLKREVERLVTHVNGEFSEPGWVPINYIYAQCLGKSWLPSIGLRTWHSSLVSRTA